MQAVENYSVEVLLSLSFSKSWTVLLPTFFPSSFLYLEASRNSLVEVNGTEALKSRLSKND